MKYLVRKFLRLQINLQLRDVEGYPQYEVVGEIFTFGNKLRLYDMNGNEIIYIEQKLLDFYLNIISIKWSPVRMIKKEFTFLNLNLY